MLNSFYSMFKSTEDWIMKQKILYGYFLFIPALFFMNCSSVNFKEAKDASEDYIRFIQGDEWDLIWENTSLSYQESCNQTKMFRLREWINQELGTIISYEQTYFYLGSKIGFKDNSFVTSRYNINFDKGCGEIEFRLIKENEEFKILALDVIKKPDL